MKLNSLYRLRSIRFAVIVMVMLGALGGSAFAANQLLAGSGDDDVLFSACASQNHLRLTEHGDDCRKNEKLVQLKRSELKGDPGEQGIPGINGLHCWDLNGNGTVESEEDTNGDGVVDVYDCRAMAHPTPTATPTGTPEPPGPGPSRERVVRAYRFIENVYGIGYIGPYRTSATNQLGGVEENFFVFENGNPMTPELVDTWSIDPAGQNVTLRLKRNIPFQSPKGYEFHDFGELNAFEVAEWFNRNNVTTNPESTYGDGGDLAGIFLEAVPTGPYTVEIGLVSPVFFCLPISQFGCLSAARGPHKVTTVEEFGFDWARSHHVGTGPYVQGACLPGVQCTVHAVENHWRADPKVKEIVGIASPDQASTIALLRNGVVDMAELDFALLPDVVNNSPLRFLETMPGGFVGQSVIFSGNLWEEFHARTGAPLNPWDSPVYDFDMPWLGDPWQESHPGNVRYVDTNNPAGMTDMEQARLVRLALSTAIDRDYIVDEILNGDGTPIYSEYMGPEYPGWNPDRQTNCFDVDGNSVACSGTVQSVKWGLDDGDLVAANELLEAAGYPFASRDADFGTLVLQAYAAETGPISFPVADDIMARWSALNINVEQLIEDYGGVISPRMRERIQFWPVLKNGDVHSNVFPLDWPLPLVDTSSSRPGWGVGFESPAGAKWLFEIFAEQDASIREQKHLNWVDYSMFWVQYAGVYQIPKGIVVGERIKTWNGRQQHYSNVSSNPEFIELK